MKKWCSIMAATLVAISPACFGFENLNQYKTAKDLWAHIQKLMRGIADPQTSQAARDAIASATAQLETRFPTDPLRWNAKLVNESVAPPDEARLETGMKEILAAPDAPASAKRGARLTLLQAHGGGLFDRKMSPAVSDEIAAYVHDYPNDQFDARLQRFRLEWLQKTDPAQAASLLAALLKDPNPAVVTMAHREGPLLDAMKKALDLSFIDDDGTRVDVSKYRGKVLLIDFWDSRIVGPRSNEPEIVKTYTDFHQTGFEVIGISFDDDKTKASAAAQKMGMIWPHYLDWKHWGDDFAERLGIEIPRMILLNKQGVVVDLDVQRGSLEEQVKKLLAQ